MLVYLEQHTVIVLPGKGPSPTLSEMSGWVS